MAKPTGVSGALKVTATADGAVKEFLQLELPKEKAAVEEKIAKGFIAAAAQVAAGGQAVAFTNLVRNAEDDFDFTVTVAGGEAYLELMEAAPLTGPYENAPAQYKPYDFATKVLAQVREKAAKYPVVGTKPIYLLLYITHWTFLFSDTAINCLRYWLAALPSPFAGVFLYMPMMGDEGVTYWFYPADLPAGFHPNQVINNVVTNFDPRSAKVIEGESGAVGFEIPV